MTMAARAASRRRRQASARQAPEQNLRRPPGGDFDRLMITTRMLIRQHHRCPHPKGSELLPEPHRAVVAEVAARLPSNAVAWGR
jgi:hypothetical protein